MKSAPPESGIPAGATLVVLLATLLATAPPALAQVDLIGRPVAEVHLETAASSLAAEAREALTLAAGDDYTIERVRESLQNLWALGTVEDVRVRVAEAEHGLSVTFDVTPRIRLRSVEFTGDSPWGDGRMRRALTAREGAALTEATVRRQEQRLQEALADDGWLLAEVEGRVLPGDRPTRGRLQMHVQAGLRARLEALELEGTLALPESRVREELGLPVGDVFRPSELEAGIDRLRAALLERHYFFHAIEVLEQSLDLDSGATTVALKVEAGPEVELSFGSLEIPEEDLHEQLVIFEFGTVDDWALKEARHQLVGLLQERGHWRPLVSYSRSRDEQERNVDIQYRILAGQRMELQRIRFEGNGTVAEAVLEAAIRTNTGGLFGGGRFLSEWWQQDREAVETVFRRRGYLEAEVVDAPVEATDDGLTATMVIEPGVRTHVHEIRIDVHSDYPTVGIDTEEWSRSLEVEAGAPHDPTAVRRDTDRLRAMLTNSGYPRGLVVHEIETLQGAPPQVRVVQNLHPGERVRIDRVMVTGNIDTNTEAIRRELRFLSGSPYSFADILESQSRLYRTGLFDEVDVTEAEPDSLDGHRSMVVRVHEAPEMFINYGGGFDTHEKLRGIFAIGHENVFGGNQEANLSTRLSLREQRVRLLYREPYLFGRRLEATATSFFTKEEESSFDVQRWGGSLNLLLRRRGDLDLIGRYSFRDVRTSNIRIDPALIERQDRSTRVGSFGGALIYDTRPDPIDPRGGVYQTFDLDVASKRLGSAQNFVTFFGRSFWYFDLHDRLVVAAAARGGLKLPFGSTVNVPLPERFFAGGSTTLRGFPYDGAGPVDDLGTPLGGEALVIANLEIRVSIWGNLGAAIFFDWGNVFAKPTDVTLSNMREIFGIGARYETPIGPVRADLARLLDRRTGEDRYQLFVSVGHTF